MPDLKGTILGLAITAVLFMILYLYEFDGLGGKLSETVALMASIVGTAILIFLFQLLVAPFHLHSEVTKKSESLSGAMDKIKNQSDLMRILIATHDDLLAEYEAGYTDETSEEFWLQRMEEKICEVERLIEEKFSPNLLFRFRNYESPSWKKFKFEESTMHGDWFDNKKRSYIWGKVKILRNEIEDSHDVWRPDLDEYLSKVEPH